MYFQVPEWYTRNISLPLSLSLSLGRLESHSHNFRVTAVSRGEPRDLALRYLSNDNPFLIKLVPATICYPRTWLSLHRLLRD